MDGSPPIRHRDDAVGRSDQSDCLERPPEAFAARVETAHRVGAAEEHPPRAFERPLDFCDRDHLRAPKNRSRNAP